MQPHNFFSTDATPSHSSRKNLILNSKKSPASTQEVSESEVPVHVPLRRPRPFRFERLRVPVWNPYSRGRLGPAKSEDPKGGEGKTDANLTHFLSTDAAGGTPTRRHALGRLPTPPPLPENLLLRLHRKLSTDPATTEIYAPSPHDALPIPLRRPRPFRFERLRVPVWNPY